MIVEALEGIRPVEVETFEEHRPMEYETFEECRLAEMRMRIGNHRVVHQTPRIGLLRRVGKRNFCGQKENEMSKSE